MCSRKSCLTLLFALLLPLLATAQTPSTPQTRPEIKKTPATYTSPASGKDMYKAYCASCHGEDGTGNGPAAPALKVPPTNLTLLAVKNHGVFPETHVAAVIRGEAVSAAHGSKDMPVWGPVFFSMGQHETSVVQLRIRNLTKYLESMQQR